MKTTETKQTQASAKREQIETDINELILADHKALKQLIKVLKDSDKKIEERMAAYAEFAPLLVTHAKPEEETLYVYLKRDEEMREMGFEGDVEHALADQLLEEIKRTEDEDVWSAKVKVVAELVEHHIKEEESEMLPEFKKSTDVTERRNLGELFLKLKKKLVDQKGEDSPSEEDIEQKEQVRH